ncbi:MAG: extracellular solute-binding protein [Caldilineaceae bacterium]|nr:extracellular solute-binding protein [Caldilineaceae bacterium]MDE0312255.1 extracellular solute-binding protein [Caldilineaceae bacterium]
MTIKSSRRDFLKVSGSLVAGAAVAGCVAPVAPPAAGMEDSAPSSERVALRFLNKWGSGARRELMNGFLDQWAEENPQVGIIFEPVADFDRRMPILVAAGEWGDIMLFNDLKLSAFHEIAADLTPYFEAKGLPFPGEEGSEMIRIPKHVGYEPGKVKAVPFQLNIVITGINKDLFKEAGVPMPWEHDHNGDKWWDWHDYREAACAINDLGENIYGAQYSAGHLEQDGLINWSVSNGGQLIDVENKKGSWNTPEFIEGQNFAVDMICQDGCMLNVDDYNGHGTALGMNPWVAGVVGITCRGDLAWAAQSEADLTQVAWVRSPNTGKSAGLGSMHFHIVTTQSQHPEESFDFIRYLANFENQKKIALSGQAEPVNAGVWQDADYQATWGGPEAVEARLDAFDNFVFTPQLPGVLEWFGEIKIVWGPVLRCETTVEEQVIVADKMTDEILAAHA